MRGYDFHVVIHSFFLLLDEALIFSEGIQKNLPSNQNVNKNKTFINNT